MALSTVVREGEVIREHVSEEKAKHSRERKNGDVFPRGAQRPKRGQIPTFPILNRGASKREKEEKKTGTNRG